MGGGSEQEWAASEEAEALAAQMFQLCDSVAYGISLREAKDDLDKEYAVLDELLSSISDSLPFVVANCAAHVTTVHRLRQLARRYKELEVTTYGHVEGARRLGEGLRALLQLDVVALGDSPKGEEEEEKKGEEGEGGQAAAGAGAIASVLRHRTPSVTSLRQSLNLVVERMHTIGQMLMATSAAHLAVSRDMDQLVCDAANIVDNPLNSDIGFRAAPIIGATAAGSLGLILLRGALGPLGAVALGSLGALGAQEYTQSTIAPHVKQAFQRVYDEASQVSSLIDSKASALNVIASDVMSSSVLLDQLLAVSSPSQPSVTSNTYEASTGLALAEELKQSLAALQLRCSACAQRLTAFMALTYKLNPKSSRKQWQGWGKGTHPRHNNGPKEAWTKMGETKTL